MPGFNTQDEIVNCIGNDLRQGLIFQKQGPASVSTGVPHSLWASSGIPVAGTNTTSGKANGRVCTSATTGAMPYGNPTAPATMHLLDWWVWTWTSSFGAGHLILVDRIADCQIAHNEASGNFTGLDATSRLNAATAPGSGAMIWLEVTSGLSAGSNTLNFTYTNQLGTGSRVTPNFSTVASTAAQKNPCGSVLWLPLQSGDTGVRSIESVTLVGGTATGNINVCLVRPLATLPVGDSQLVAEDFSRRLPNLERLFDSSCLSFIWVPGTTAQGPLTGIIGIGEN